MQGLESSTGIFTAHQMPAGNCLYIALRLVSQCRGQVIDPKSLTKRSKEPFYVGSGHDATLSVFSRSVDTPSQERMCPRYCTWLQKKEHLNSFRRKPDSYKHCRMDWRFCRCSWNILPSTIMSSRLTKRPPPPTGAWPVPDPSAVGRWLGHYKTQTASHITGKVLL